MKQIRASNDNEQKKKKIVQAVALVSLAFTSQVAISEDLCVAPAHGPIGVVQSETSTTPNTVATSTARFGKLAPNFEVDG